MPAPNGPLTVRPTRLLVTLVLTIALLVAAVPIRHQGAGKRREQEQVLAALRSMTLPASAAVVHRALARFPHTRMHLAVLDEPGNVLARRGQPASGSRAPGSIEQIGEALGIWLPEAAPATAIDDPSGIGSVVVEATAAPAAE